ncbi:hypothetical protein DEO72_LG5g2376 [Vigna unguiculata]|uniref:Uncharacterized protein n=1 Tax=Vigna unguiculata TaxID=3917 RepID=A0A4D6M0L8_VIGUN|nr:hypothetical protein DEO72_LG5g2376 [Vigna unguiculata]
MDTEEFSFPRITDTCSHTIDSPPLWNLSPAASPNPYQGNRRGENDCFGAAKLVAEVHRKSFSCVENRRKKNGFEEEEEEEEKMDLLWEDFNEELYSTTTTGSATSSSREVVEFRNAHELTLAKTTHNSLLHPTKNKPAMVVIVKIFKKLFSIHNSQGRSRKAVR